VICKGGTLEGNGDRVCGGGGGGNGGGKGVNSGGLGGEGPPRP